MKLAATSLYNRNVFELREYRQGDFESLHRIDRLCFAPGIAYSRAELQSFIQRKRSFCLVAVTTAAETAAEGKAESKQGKPRERKTAPPAAATEASDFRPRIAGFIVVEMREQGYGHIITLDILEEFRRHHLGSRLMEAAEQRVRRLGGFMMVLETAIDNHAALAFYQHHRYKVLKRLEGYYGNGADAYFYTKRL